MGPDGSELETAAIITTSSNAAIAKIHDRMPVVINPENFAQWLDIKNVGAEEAAQFLKPAPDDYFVFEPAVIERTSPPPKPKPQLTLF